MTAPAGPAGAGPSYPLWVKALFVGGVALFILGVLFAPWWARVFPELPFGLMALGMGCLWVVDNVGQRMKRERAAAPPSPGRRSEDAE